jgi:hypothetical protein
MRMISFLRVLAGQAHLQEVYFHLPENAKS